MTSKKVEQKVFELFDELVKDFDPDAYTDICGVIAASFLIRTEDP